MDCKRVTWLSSIPQPTCPIPLCTGCPKISTCDSRAPRPLPIGHYFEILPAAPQCHPSPCKHRIESTLPPQFSDKANIKHPHSSVGEEVHKDSSDSSLEEFRYRWKNESCDKPSQLTGYNTMPFARPIPKYSGFKPRYPYPMPQQISRPTTIDIISTLKDQFRCPSPCEQLCTPYIRSPLALCVTQVHPYIPFSAAVKMTNTW